MTRSAMPPLLYLSAHELFRASVLTGRKSLFSGAGSTDGLMCHPSNLLVIESTPDFNANGLGMLSHVPNPFACAVLVRWRSVIP